MNPGGNPSHQPHAHLPSAGMGVDDVLFTLFRHKWLILGFFCLGLMGAAIAPLIKPPRYESRAKLMVHYVVERGAGMAGNGGQVIPSESGGQGMISTEVEILKSRDVA